MFDWIKTKLGVSRPTNHFKIRVKELNGNRGIRVRVYKFHVAKSILETESESRLVSEFITRMSLSPLSVEVIYRGIDNINTKHMSYELESEELTPFPKTKSGRVNQRNAND